MNGRLDQILTALLDSCRRSLGGSLESTSTYLGRRKSRAKQEEQGQRELAQGHGKATGW